MIGEPVWFARRYPEDMQRTAGWYVARLAVFGVSEVLAATGFGAFLGLLGAWLLADIEPTLVAAIAGVVGLAVLARETIGHRVPVPQVPWQVPRQWMRAFWGGAVAFGGIMGIGALTRQPSSLFHLYVIACIVSADAKIGAALGGIYGATYLAGFLYGTIAWREETGGGQEDRALAMSRWARWIGGLAAPLVVVLVPGGVLT